MAFNFTDDARLVTLTYADDKHPRSRELAVLYQSEWVRRVRAACRTARQEPTYVTAIEWPGSEAGPVHRTVLSCEADAEALAGLWEYGPAKAERIDLTSGWSPVAALLMRGPIGAGQTPIPCARSWTTSIGLPLPQKIREDV